jgi:hypothetical protein
LKIRAASYLSLSLEAALKLLYLAIRNAGMRWCRGIEWTAPTGQFIILFGDRFQRATK